MADPESDISRRKLLGATGTIGAAAALGGTGSLAFFSDEEEFSNNRLTAGSLDLKIAWQELYYGEHAEEALDSGAYSLGDFLSADATTRELYPDPDTGASASFAEIRSTPCAQQSLYADAPDDLDPRTSYRSNNPDTIENGQPKPLISIQDAKPGDFGFTRFRLALCDNPGYVWTTGGIQSLAENGTTEPERKDPDSAGAVSADIADEIRVRLFHDRTGTAVGNFFADLDGSTNGGDLVEAVFDLFALDDTAPTLSEFSTLVSTGHGFPLDGNPFDGGVPDGVARQGGDLFLYGAPDGGGQVADRDCFDTSGEASDLGLVWGLPVDHANEIQTDSVTVDVGFYTEQCRHNDGEGIGNS
jgi:predicted ribosomally synthesized peptide with SipW-like signal peptide